MNLKSTLKNIFSKIGIGICYGIGISIALIIMVYGYGKIFFEKSDYDKYIYADGSEITDLEITKHKLAMYDRESIEIIGAVQNNGDFEWSGIEFEIELYDEENNFVYECSDKIEAKILPSQIENFKVDCNLCNKSVPNFAKYEIKIVDAFGRKLKK